MLICFIGMSWNPQYISQAVYSDPGPSLVRTRGIIEWQPGITSYQIPLPSCRASRSRVLAHSISNQQNSLFKARGWADLTPEQKALRKEIGRITEDYEEIKRKEFDEDKSKREGDGHGGNTGRQG